MKFNIRAKGGLYDAYIIKNQVYKKWEELLTEFNKNASPGINKTL